jgi:hypothetical protein
MIAVFYAVDAQSQTSKVEEFINKYSEQEGATYVELSKTMLDATFNSNNVDILGLHTMDMGPFIVTETVKRTFDGTKDSVVTQAVPKNDSPTVRLQQLQELQLLEQLQQQRLHPGASKAENKEKYPQKFKSLILNDDSKAAELKQALNGYEIMMKSKKGNKTEATYFHDSGTADKKEIVIMKHHDKQLSITYMQGNLDIRLLQSYLMNTRVRLSQMGMVDMFHY